MLGSSELGGPRAQAPRELTKGNQLDISSLNGLSPRLSTDQIIALQGWETKEWSPTQKLLCRDMCVEKCALRRAAPRRVAPRRALMIQLDPRASATIGCQCPTRSAVLASVSGFWVSATIGCQCRRSRPPQPPVLAEGC